MHLFLSAEDSETALQVELRETFASAVIAACSESVFGVDFNLQPGRLLSVLAFSRQMLPNAGPLHAESIRGWAEAVFQRIIEEVPEQNPWSFHLASHYGRAAHHRIGARAWHTIKTRHPATEILTEHQEARNIGTAHRDAGRHRCQLIREAILELMRKRRRHLLRHLTAEPQPFTPTASLIQLLLTDPENGFVSVARAPLPFEQRHLISMFPKGDAPIASDPSAPSRAFAKLIEAEARLGAAIEPGQTCADLGASPGGWTYVALNRGSCITAVDRAPLRTDLMEHERVSFVRGDAFKFEPASTVDWLLCDVIAPPEQSAELLLHWLRRQWCRRFVVTLKMKDNSGDAALKSLKGQLQSLAQPCFLTRLSANKKELCAFGVALPQPRT